MAPPGLSGLPLFLGEIMPLINTDNAAERSARMIQQPFDCRQTNTEPRHTGRHGPPEVVQNPGLPARWQKRIEPTFAQPETTHRRRTGRSKREGLADSR